MGADSEAKSHENGIGDGNAILFLFLSLGIGVLSLWLGGLAVGYFAFILFGLLFVNFFAGHRRYRFSIIFLFVSIGLLVGWLVYQRLSTEEISQAMSRLPLLGSLLARPAAQAVLAAVTGFASGGLAGFGALELAFSLSGDLILGLRQVHGLTRMEVRRLFLLLILGRTKIILTADGGEIQPEGDLKKFGKPLAVVVKPYNALVLEQGSEVSRIEGPQTVRLQRGELVRAVVDLRPQAKDFELEVLTRDNVPIKVGGSVSFRIEAWREARDREDEGDFETKGFSGIISGAYPVYRRTIYRAVYGLTAGKTWQSQIRGMAGGQVAKAIRGFRIDQIFLVDEAERVSVEETALQKIVEQAKAGAVKGGLEWGATVAGLSVKNISMPEEAQQEFIQRWSAPWKGWRELVEAEAKSRAAFVEAESEHKVARLEAESKQWRIVREAIAKLEATTHQNEATLRDARAKSEATRIRARSHADAEIVFFEHLAEAFARIFGIEGAKEILQAMAKQKVDLDQMRKLMSIIKPSARDMEGGFPRTRWLGQGEEETLQEEE